MADPSYPYSVVDLLTFLQTFNPPAWCFDREVPCIWILGAEGIGKEIEEMKAPTSIPKYTKKYLAMYLYPTCHLLHQSNQLVYWVDTELSSWIQQAKIDLQNVRVVFFHGINETYKFRSR